MSIGLCEDCNSTVGHAAYCPRWRKNAMTTPPMVTIWPSYTNQEDAMTTPTTGMGGHHSAKMQKDEWLTPPAILRALGPFDLDPCSPVTRPWDTAARHFTIHDNGLSQEWSGRVWCNPPYGLEADRWLERLAAHGNGIALIFARTETVMFFRRVWNVATAVLFIEGRLFFHHVSGQRAKANAGAPSVLIAYGDDNAARLEESGIAGKFIRLRTP